MTDHPQSRPSYGAYVSQQSLCVTCPTCSAPPQHACADSPTQYSEAINAAGVHPGRVHHHIVLAEKSAVDAAAPPESTHAPWVPSFIVDCPTCHAVKGEPCLSDDGTNRTLFDTSGHRDHTMRSNAYLTYCARLPPRDSAVDHPPHYNAHPSGVECIDVVEHMTFNVGNAVKYLWRADHKGARIDDLKKSAWYVQREIERLTKEKKP